MKDYQIDRITEQVAESVPGATQYGILTACVIDGEFVCVTNYSISDELYRKLARKACEVQGMYYCEHNDSVTYPAQKDDDGLVTYQNDKGFNFL